MKQLSREEFERARQFLKTRARPLERTMFEYRFENGTVENVIAELARFQNADGGFGHALEPDSRAPSSSALATGIALHSLVELGCDASHPMVRQALAYLRATFNPQTQVWRVVPPDANNFPHAPWWHDENGSLARTFDEFRIIPRVLILASLWHFVAAVPRDWLDALTRAAVTYIEKVSVLGGGGGSDLEYAIILAEEEKLPREYHARLVARIRAAIPTVVVRDPAKWSAYSLNPLKIAPTPQTFGSDLIWDDLQTNLDFAIENQTAEGTWEPTWMWSGAYPEAWEQAKLEWRGHLTLEMLTMLRAYGRLE
ncbi:MAG: hypothetical protein HY868_24795 [Chloroflexi bacterium]|nr:hypothetical protein [Chloroflexota bacterium]